ncbi:Os05g0490200, partial [Oryza sativa Japonica Group]
SYCYLHSQFSVTEHFRDGNIRPKPQPGVFFFYDFSPIKVVTMERNSYVVMFIFLFL